MIQDDYAHYPHPDEYLNERSQQFIAQEQYGQIGMGNGGHQQQPMDQDCKLFGRNSFSETKFQLDLCLQKLNPEKAKIAIYLKTPDNISDNLYGDVSGLPDPYMGQQGGDMMMAHQQQQHQQPHFHGHAGHQMPPPPPPGGVAAGAGGHFDDSQDEHDFSPNGKSRRIIREIIV